MKLHEEAEIGTVQSIYNQWKQEKRPTTASNQIEEGCFHENVSDCAQESDEIRWGSHRLGAFMAHESGDFVKNAGLISLTAADAARWRVMSQ